jgi:hypothetical protein
MRLLLKQNKIYRSKYYFNINKNNVHIFCHSKKKLQNFNRKIMFCLYIISIFPSILCLQAFLSYKSICCYFVQSQTFQGMRFLGFVTVKLECLCLILSIMNNTVVISKLKRFCFIAHTHIYIYKTTSIKQCHILLSKLSTVFQITIQ